MNVLEKELEDLIWEKLESGDYESLSYKGLIVDYNSRFYRQYNFGSYGIADIVSLSVMKSSNWWTMNVHIYELKKDDVNLDTLSQSARYAKAAQRMADDWNYMYSKKRKIHLNVTIHLIGKRITNGGLMYLPDIFKGLHLYEYKLDFDEGIIFDRKIDYHLAEESKFIFPKVHGAFITRDDD